RRRQFPVGILGNRQRERQRGGHEGPKDGSSSPVTLASGETFPHAIRAGEKAIYWATATTSAPGQPPDGTILKLGADGGTPTVLAAGVVVTDLAIDASFLYWCDIGDFTIKKVSLDGGAPVTLANSDGHPDVIAVDGSRVYWGDRNLGVLMSVGVEG